MVWDFGSGETKGKRYEQIKRVYQKNLQRPLGLKYILHFSIVLGGEGVQFPCINKSRNTV